MCPRCGGREAWRLPSCTPLTFGFKDCGKEKSVTAGTVMHRTHLPLSVWFWAAWLVATHSNGMSENSAERAHSVLRDRLATFMNSGWQ